jgi:hypothetical protein
MTAHLSLEQLRSLMRTTLRVRTALIAPIVLALTSAAMIGLGATVPSVAATPSPTGLSVTIDNGTATTKPDSDVSYTITLANAGTTSVTAWIVASVPAYGRIVDAGGGQVKDENDTWKVTVGAGKKQTETVAAHIGDIPPGTDWVTTVASVYLSKDTSRAPVIRTADSDTVPGAKAPAVATPPRAASPDSDTTSIRTPVLIGIAGGVAIIAAVLAPFVVGRRTRKTGRRDRRRGEGNGSESPTRPRGSKEGQHSVEGTRRR